MGRAGRFGTKGLAVTFVASAEDSAVLNQVQERFDVDIKPLPESVSTLSKEACSVPAHGMLWFVQFVQPGFLSFTG